MLSHFVIGSCPLMQTSVSHTYPLGTYFHRRGKVKAFVIFQILLLLRLFRWLGDEDRQIFIRRVHSRFLSNQKVYPKNLSCTKTINCRLTPCCLSGRVCGHEGRHNARLMRLVLKCKKLKNKTEINARARMVLNDICLFSMWICSLELTYYA